ncbi:MAG: tripartite tricarboxylate transporter TctB family protein [Deltaproteobacteria bacterium]|nr:tripartite tricarboxylate transporter TctB family protein [Deltaproteobacteria bacterium]
MKKGLIVVSIFLMGVSLFGMTESSRMERTMKMGVGIGFLPFWTSALIGILSLTLFINTLQGKKIQAGHTLFTREKLGRVVFMAIILLVYLTLFEVIGYLLSTFLFFAATILFLQRGRFISIVIYGAAFTFLLYAIFKMWLKSPLPAGFLGI